MTQPMWALLLIALSGLLLGGAITTWRASKLLAVALGACAALALAAGVLRSGYF
ncbi:hypothetical protein [Salinactinospora qingdaonensis]|uniref:Uncharacterized protein n=1 Tax=Salinactinospora qingdaonensis TaxID=702744 RepID=A0ABP7FM83_9ACTN